MREIGVFHRDLNAKNLLVTDQNAITLIDFDYAGHGSPQSKNFLRRHRRDIETLLASCAGAPQVVRILTRQLNHG